MNRDYNLFSNICKTFILFTFFSNCSNGTEIEKQEISSVITPQIEIDAPYYSKNSEFYPRRKFFMMAGEYLWIFNKDEMMIVGPRRKTTIPYKQYRADPCIIKELDPSGLLGTVRGKTPCIPRPLFFSRNHLNFSPRGLNAPKNFGVFDDRVIITLGLVQYIYKMDGTFIEKNKLEDWWELNEGPYKKYPWRVEIAKKKVFFGDKEFSSMNANVFSGPWVAMVKVPITGPRKYDLLFVDRTTGEIVRTFEDQSIYERAAGYFREYGDGFYLDKSKRPFLFFGKEIVSLETKNDTFCYVYNEKKKCVPDPQRKLLEVIENKYMRLFIDKDRIWVERHSKKK